MGSESFHEQPELLKPETRDRHRAIASLLEELDAIDWYDQRIDATGDPELAQILAHNRDEEKEHAAMVLEWLRRRDPTLDHVLRTYLQREGAIAVDEDEEESGGAPAGDGSLGIGSLKGRKS